MTEVRDEMTYMAASSSRHALASWLVKQLWLPPPPRRHFSKARAGRERNDADPVRNAAGHGGRADRRGPAQPSGEAQRDQLPDGQGPQLGPAVGADEADQFWDQVGEGSGEGGDVRKAIAERDAGIDPTVTRV